MKEIEKIIIGLKEEAKARAVIVALRNGIYIEGTGVEYPSDKLSAAVAMLATAFGAAETAEGNLGNEIPECLIIASRNKDRVPEDITIVGAGPKAILIIRTPNPRTGAEWFNEMLKIKEAAQEIKKILV